MSGRPEHRRTASELEHRRLQYLLAEAVEKLFRLQRILERQRSFVEAEYRNSEYTNVIDTLVNALTSFEQLLTQNCDRLARFLQAKQVTEEHSKAVYGIIRRVLDPVLKIHELLVLLPRESAEPQVFFMLGDCFGRKRRLPASVILTNQTSSYEYRVEDVLQSEMSQQELPSLRLALRGFRPGANVLGLAFADRDNPLAWAVLAHEYAHTIDDTRKIAHDLVHSQKRRTGTSDETRRTQVRWVAEVFSDLVAARILGPAALLPILFVEMARPTVGGASGSPSHPPTPVRLRLARDYLETLQVGTSAFEDVFGVYELDYAQKLHALTRTRREKHSHIRKVADAFLSPLATEIASKVGALKLRRFGEDNWNRARKLQTKLEAGLPISCHRYFSDNEVFAELGRLTERSSVRTVYATLGKLNEVPAASSEIIAAGWLYRLSTFRDVLREAFPGRRARLDLYGEYLERTDALLMKSIELASVQDQINSPNR